MKSIHFLIGICILLNVYAARTQCSFTVDAGPDLKVCNPGDMVMINGKVTGSVQEIFWEPPTGLSNPRSPVTKATVPGPIEYILTARGVSNINLITNGNFEAGNTGFTTDYMVGMTSCYGAGYLDCEGTYGVINNPQLGHTGFAPCGDHTSGSGLMMVLNGSANLQNVWCQTINVMPDMDYIFSAWVTSVVSASPPILQFSINGTNIGNIFNSSGVNCSWEQFQTTWNSGSNTTAEICIVNLNTATGGNDFAIDDITFRKICEIKDTMKIEVEEIIIAIENPELMTCDQPRFKLDASASSSGTGWKYQWTTSDGKIISGGTTLSPTIEGPGTYYLTICSPLPNCCKTEYVTVLGNIKPPDLQLIVKDTIGCNVQAASINSRSKVFPLEYEWDGPNGFSSTDPSIVVTSGGKYTLTITDEYNCKTIDSIEVFERIDNPKISIRSNPINCQTDTADLIGSSSVPGSSFEWTGPNQFYIKADSFQTIDSGWFILKVVTPSGCIKTDSVLISKDLNKPQFQYTSDTITCKNDSALVSVNANINPASFGWHSAQNFTIKDTFTISTRNPGIYTFYAVGTNGCSDSINITVPVDTIHPVISPINDTLNCIKTEVRLISGNTDPNTDISWQDPAGMDIFQDSLDVSIPGMYRVRAISENGCQRIQDIFIGIDTLHPLLTVRNDTLNCNKQKIKLQLTDVSSSRYFWTGPGSFIDTTQQPEIQIPGIYQVLASLANGCMSTAQILIEIDTIKPIINYSSDTLNCKKDSVQLLVSADKTDAVFLWTGPNGFQSIQKNPYTSLSGNYKLHVTNINGCSDSISLTIYQDIRKPEIYLEPDTLNCLKRNALLHGKTNRDSLLYTWSGPNGLNSTDSILSINTGGAYRLQVESLEGCKSEVTILVFEDTAKALLQIDPDTLNCLITEWTASLQSSLTPADISWSGPNGFTSKMLNPKISNGGNYTVQLTTPNQCISMLTFNILQDTLRPAIQYTGDSITCSHPDAILTANTTPSTLLGIWTGPLGQNQPGNSLQTKTGGNYNFQVTGSNFCTNQIATFVKVDTLAPDLNLSGDTITCLQPRVPLVAKSLTPGISLNWNGPSNFMSTLDSLQILIPGLYTASITAPNGCKSVQNILIPIDTIHPVVVLSADSINCKRIEANLSAQVNPAFTNYRWTDLNNITLSNQLIYKTNKGGVFQFIATNPKNGCQTFKLQTVFEDSLIIRDVLLTQDHPVCGNSFGSMNIAKVIGGHEGLLFAINDPNLFSSQSLFSSLPAGVYTLYIKDSADCRFEKSFEILQIPIVDANIQPEISLRLGKGGTLDLNITSDPNLVKNIDWTPKTFLSCTNCEDPIATPPGDLEYEVTVTDTNGCTITKRILVKIETPKVWAPNVFSPNGDQINDWFYLISSDPDITAINILEIFDRWGNKVFVSAQQKPNNAINGWNGTAKNEKCLPGVYVYWAEVELINGTKWILKGDITLLK